MGSWAQSVAKRGLLPGQSRHTADLAASDLTRPPQPPAEDCLTFGGSPQLQAALAGALQCLLDFAFRLRGAVQRGAAARAEGTWTQVCPVFCRKGLSLNVRIRATSWRSLGGTCKPTSASYLRQRRQRDFMTLNGLKNCACIDLALAALSVRRRCGWTTPGGRWPPRWLTLMRAFSSCCPCCKRRAATTDW